MADDDKKKTKDTGPKQVKTADIQMGIQNGSEQLWYATWKWSKSHTKEFKVLWEYYTTDKVKVKPNAKKSDTTNLWFVGNESTTTQKQSTFTPPENASKLRFRVLPIAEDKKEGKGSSSKTVPYWTAKWSAVSGKNAQKKKVTTEHPISWKKEIGSVPLEAPSAPTVTLDDAGTLTASVEVYAARVDSVQFEIVENNSKKIQTTTVKLKTNYAETTRANCPLGKEYKARARCYDKNTKKYSPWSEYTSVEPRILEAPSAPTVVFSADNHLTVSVDVGDTPANYVQFQTVYSNEYTFGKTANNKISTGHAEHTYTEKILANTYYKARARLLYSVSGSKKKYSKWSEYSANQKQETDYTTIPVPPTPTLTVNGTSITAEVNIYSSTVKYINFELRDNNGELVEQAFNCEVNNAKRAMYTFKKSIKYGTTYRVRAQALKKKSGTQWSEWSEYASTAIAPFGVPPVPTVSIDDVAKKLIVEVNGSLADTKSIIFEIVENNSSKASTSKEVTFKSAHAELVKTGIKRNINYKARAQAVSTGGTKSAWSDYSANQKLSKLDDPSVPTVSMNGKTFKVECNYYGSDVTHIDFEIVANNSTAVKIDGKSTTKRVALKTNYASVAYTGAYNTDYKARVRAHSDNLSANSEWSEYSSNERAEEAPYEAPSAPTVTIKNKTLTATTDIYTEGPDTVKFQIVENNSKDVLTKEVAIKKNHAEVTFTNLRNKATYKARVLCLKKSTKKQSNWSQYSSNEQYEAEPVATPPSPSISLDGVTVTAEANVYTAGVTQIQFQILENNGSKPVLDKTVTLKNAYAFVTYKGSLNKYYRVRIRSYDGKQKKYSEWTEYVSTEPVEFGVPPVPSLSLDGTTVIAEVNAYILGASHIEFELVRDDTKVIETKKVSISTNSARYMYKNVAVGSRYKVRARCYSNTQKISSGWSEYSNSEQVSLDPPQAPAVSISTDNKFKAAVEVYVEGATNIQFEIVKNNSSVVTLPNSGLVAITKNHAEISINASFGVTYKARARCYISSSKQYSKWSEYASVEPVEFTSPPVPQISISEYKLKAETNPYILGATHIQFQVVKDNKDVVKTQQVAIVTNYASMSMAVVAKAVYKVRARCYSSGTKLYSAWSEYSSNAEQEVEPLGAPPTPLITIENFTLKAESNVYVVGATGVQFQIVKDNKTTVKTGKATIVMNHAAFSCAVDAGSKYKVRARCYSATEESEWSEYSEEVGTVPGKVASITSISAQSPTSVKLDWSKANDATGYEIQYTSDKTYFDTAPNEVRSVTIETAVTTGFVTGLEGGRQWFFRVRATNANGSGGWSPIASVAVGTTPSAPTTWSYTTTATVGEDVVLNWAHNSEDESVQTAAQIELTVNGQVQTVTVNDSTSLYTYHTTGLADGSTIYWRVRTKGAVASYSPWSTKRLIMVYAPPSLELMMYGGTKWVWDTFNFVEDTVYTAKGDLDEVTEEIDRYPFYISLNAVPATQKAISYTVTVTSNQTYETVDGIGVSQQISENEQIYSGYFTPETNNFLLELGPSDIDLENGMQYTVHATVSFESGLSASDDYEFSVSWDDEELSPDAIVYVDDENFTASIKPVCVDTYGNPMSEVLLNVYRREYNGTFVAIMNDIPCDENITITDPHPSLDYARYRVVAVSKRTGSVSYYDVPGVYVGHNSIVVQWAEEWSYFNIDSIYETNERAWSGSLLDLPYNIDISINNDPDVSLVKYIGRSHPVSYYGTQKGETASWNMTIPKDDEETIYGIRRLANYPGDVYVREPSGIGYWANVKVSYNISHNNKEVPVTFDITRVDGGV